MKSIYIVITLSLLAFLLVSCGDFKRHPFFSGNFNGSFAYENDKDTSIPFSMTLQLGEVLKLSYTFSGSATLGDDTLNVSGEGKATPEWNGFLRPQASPPPAEEDILITFENTTNNMKMCIEQERQSVEFYNWPLSLAVSNCEGEIVGELQLGRGVFVPE